MPIASRKFVNVQGEQLEFDRGHLEKKLSCTYNINYLNKSRIIMEIIYTNNSFMRVFYFIHFLKGF